MSGRRIGVGRGAVVPIERRYRASVEGAWGPLADVCARADRDGTRRHVLGNDGVRAHDAASSEREAVALLRDDACAGTDGDAVLDDDAHAGAGVRAPAATVTPWAICTPRPMVVSGWITTPIP